MTRPPVVDIVELSAGCLLYTSSPPALLGSKLGVGPGDTGFNVRFFLRDFRALIDIPSAVDIPSAGFTPMGTLFPGIVSCFNIPLVIRSI